MTDSVKTLLETLPQQGMVDWIGVRPARRAAIVPVNEVKAQIRSGLTGDRYAGRSGKRQVTLIQTEHLAVIASLLGQKMILPEQLRRNISVSGLNLLALKDKTFRVGDAVLEYTGLCHPCSFMETTFGAGGYNAVRGHGGITARVIQPGIIRVGDPVTAAPLCSP